MTHKEMEAFANILISKLTKEELRTLCLMYDEGWFDNMYFDYLVRQNKKNFPDQYME